MHFCWDSIIDKKVYETWITFGYPVWEMMLTPYPSPWDASVQEYRRYLVIGLAPEGRVRVWLENTKKPNTRLTEDKDILVETVSGEKLAMCKKITNHSFRGGYNDYILNFIKDKKIPLRQLVSDDENTIRSDDHTDVDAFAVRRNTRSCGG